MQEKIYDSVIVGGGISGITAGYMLRDKDILLLEGEDRFGGRVMTEDVNGAINNIGTQFFTVEESTFFHLIKELGVEWVTYDPGEEQNFFHIENKVYDNLDEFFSKDVLEQAEKFIAKINEQEEIFKLPSTDPRWQEQAAKSIVEFEQGYSKELISLVNTYMRGACISKPEHTSAGMGAHLALDIFKTGDMGFVEGGFQKITDAMVSKLDGKVMNEAEVIKVEEDNGIVTISYKKDGKEQMVKSKSAIIAVPPQIALKIVPGIPEKKRKAMEKVKYGPLYTISVYLKKDTPWERFRGGMSDCSVFQGFFDATYGTEYPIIYNFIISIPPDEEEEIKALAAQSDEEIVSHVLKDFKKMIPHIDIDKYIVDTKVSRYDIGELELSPEYFLELLPELSTSVGNIHFCGDYTHSKSFVDGAAYSGMRAARDLGSKYVVSEEDMLIFPEKSKWEDLGE